MQVSKLTRTTKTNTSTSEVMVVVVLWSLASFHASIKSIITICRDRHLAGSQLKIWNIYSWAEGKTGFRSGVSKGKAEFLLLTTKSFFHTYIGIYIDSFFPDIETGDEEGLGKGGVIFYSAPPLITTCTDHHLVWSWLWKGLHWAKLPRKSAKYEKVLEILLHNIWGCFNL